MDRRVTPPKRVTSPSWGPPPPCKQALSATFEFRFESFKSISLLILFVYKLMIGSSKNNRENYPRKCFRIPEKETRVPPIAITASIIAI